MVPKKSFVERRKRNRFHLIAGTFVEFHKPRFFNLGKPRIAKSAPIIEISYEGLAFKYVDRNMWPHNFNVLSISIIDQSNKINEIPFKAVSDFSLSRLPNSKFIRRCGIKFGKLTTDQKSQLYDLIQNNTKDIA
jgi:hypothetical protein